LYDAYDRDKDKPDPIRVKVCADEAIDMARRIAGAHTGVHPSECPPHVAVIGPVSYSILSYGLPKYREENGQAYFESNNDDYAKLLIYRREDAALASLILGEVDKEMERIAPTPKSQSHLDEPDRIQGSGLKAKTDKSEPPHPPE
jgi:hypothetical protein